MMHPDYEDHFSRPATLAEADRQYAHEKGRDNADCAWILSDRDAWYKNPFYKGPPVPHPESGDYEDPASSSMTLSEARSKIAKPRPG